MEKPRPNDGSPAMLRKRRSVIRRRLMFHGLARWKTWTFRTAVGIPLLLVLALVVLTQTVFLKRMVLPPLEREFGLQISAGWVYVGSSGDLVMHDVQVRTPAVPGPAGAIVQVGELRADVDWGSVLSGRPKLTEIRLVDPLVRLSQSLDDGSLNLAGVPKPAAGVGGPMKLPRIVGTRVALELGEHSGQTYTILKRLNLDGTLIPTGAPATRQYAVRLHEISPRPKRPGMTLTGTIDEDGLVVNLAGVTLDDWPAAVVPTPVREQFRALDLRGDVVSTNFIARAGKWASVRLALADVSLNLPLHQAQKDGTPSSTLPAMRMSAVSGDIEFTPAGIDAKLKGRIEDLPYTVTLDFDGLSPDAPFRMDVVSENFQIAKTPDLLPYAPPLVRKRFLSFSSPTGEVDTRMTVTRGPPTPDGPAPIQISGLVNFSHVDAAYDRFPYRFPDLSGVVRFDEQGVDLVRIAGTAPSGATILATGRIAPLGSDAAVTIDIDIANLPLDEGVQAALGPKRGELVPALLSRDKYKVLADAGLILPPKRAAELTKELARQRAQGNTARVAEIEELLRAPVFSLGGLAQVHVNLRRPEGEDSDWFTTIDVHIPEAGVLVKAFPLPILARDVTLHIDDDRADLTAGTFRPASGGSAEVSVAALLHDPATGEKDFRPDVHVTARDVPADALFLAALPRGAEGPQGQGLVQSILQGLGIGGMVDATAHVVDRPDGPLGFDVHADLAHAEMSPPPDGASPPLHLVALAGAADASEDRLDVALEGSLRVAGAADGTGPDSPAGHLAVTTRVTFGGAPDDHQWSYDATVTGTNLNAAAPVEDLVRAFSQSTADAMAARRADLRPSGRADALTHIAGSSQTPTEAQVTVSRANGLGLDVFGGRAALGETSGTAVFTLGAERPVIAETRGIRALLSFDGEEAGSLALDGVYDFGGGDFGGGPSTDLAASIEGARFESAITARIVRQKLGDAAGAWWTAAQPRGLFDQRLTLRAGPDGTPDLSGEVLPRSLAFSPPPPTGAPALVGPPLGISFPSIDGAVRFSAAGGEVAGLVARSSEWSLAADGQWTTFGHGEFSAGGAATLHAQRLAPDLRAILPQDLRAALEGLAVRIDGPLSVENGKFSIARRAPPGASAPAESPAGDPAQTADYSGLVTFAGASLEAGIKVSAMDGTLEFEATQPPGGPGLQYGLKLRADRLTSSGVSMTDARARIVSGDHPGEVIVPLISARCHGGRVVGRGHAWLGGASAGDTAERRREYEASVQWSGLRFAPVMADLSAPVGDAGDSAPPEDDDLSRGIFEGELSLAGVVGDDATRRGRATMRVGGGRVLRFPLVTQLIEVSNLTPPVNAALDFARVSLLINGPVIVFEDLSIFSSVVSIFGYGTMSWPSTDLNLRFRSKAARPIPIISQIIEGLRDELIGATVKGTLAHPVVALQQFPETRRLIDRAMGQAPSGRERQMDQIERGSRETDAPPAPGQSEPVHPDEPGGAR